MSDWARLGTATALVVAAFVLLVLHIVWWPFLPLFAAGCCLTRVHQRSVMTAARVGPRNDATDPDDTHHGREQGE